MNVPESLRYARTHEWARIEGDRATVGITDHAQHELGDVVYLDLPAVGRSYQAGAVFGSIESVKAVSDLYAPVSGEVVEVNSALVDAPETVNSAPYDQGWMLVLKMSDPSEADALLDAAGYTQAASEGH
jgi:glycine cleavage system H protein